MKKKFLINIFCQNIIYQLFNPNITQAYRENTCCQPWDQPGTEHHSTKCNKVLVCQKLESQFFKSSVLYDCRVKLYCAASFCSSQEKALPNKISRDICRMKASQRAFRAQKHYNILVSRQKSLSPLECALMWS